MTSVPTGEPPPPGEETPPVEVATSQAQEAEGGRQEPGVPSAACDGGRPAASAPAGTAAEERLGITSTLRVGHAGSPVAMSTTVPGATGEGAPKAGTLGTGVEIRAHAGGGDKDRSEVSLPLKTFRDEASELIVQTCAQSGNDDASEAPRGGAQRVAPGARPIAVI